MTVRQVSLLVALIVGCGLTLALPEDFWKWLSGVLVGAGFTGVLNELTRSRPQR